MFHTPVDDLDLLSIIVVSTECDLELLLFIFVEPVCLFFDPLAISTSISLRQPTVSSTSPSTYTPLLMSSLMFKFTD